MAINVNCGCGKINPTPRFRKCPECREKEQVEKRDRSGDGRASKRNPSRYDELAWGFVVKEGHAPGWFEIM